MASANSAIVKFDNKKFETKLSVLKKMVEEIVVSDAHGYETICKLVVDGRDEIKAIGFVYDPIIASAKKHLEDVKQQKAEKVNQIQPIVDRAAEKGAAFKREEREAAEREAARLNREAQDKADAEANEVFATAVKELNALSKADLRRVEQLLRSRQITKAEAIRRRDAILASVQTQKTDAAHQAEAIREAPKVAPVTVQPNVPKVAGIRGRVNWKFKVVDASKIQRGYLIPDEVSIGQEVRRIKDKAKAEAAIPGIEVWSEDAI